MDGLRHLSQVRSIPPRLARVILTRYADFQSVMDSVNDGAVFRFLSKPREYPALKNTLTICPGQFRLITAEKKLLEKTLIGCVEAMVDVLSLANPAAFSKDLRILRFATAFGDMKAKGLGETEAREQLKAVSTLSPPALQSLKCAGQVQKASGFGSYQCPPWR